MLNQENKTMFVTGDFNINTSHAIINPNINVNNFQNIFLSYLYIPLINKHTRVDKKRGTSTLLDNIYSNVTQITNTIHSGVIKTDYSDHYSIFCDHTTTKHTFLERPIHKLVLLLENEE